MTSSSRARQETSGCSALARPDCTETDCFGLPVVIPYVPVPGADGLGEPSLDFAGRAADLDMDGKVDFMYPRLNDGARARMGAALLQSTGSTFTPFESPDHEARSFDRLPLKCGLCWRLRRGWAARYRSPDLVVVPRIAGHRGLGISAPPPVSDLRSVSTAHVDSDGPCVGLLGDPVHICECRMERVCGRYSTEMGKLEVLFRDARPGSDPEHFTTNRMLALTKFASGGSESPVRMTSLKGSGRFPFEVRYQMVDVNGDGLADAVEVPNIGGTQIRVAINNGRDFMPPIAITLPTGATLGQSSDTVDQNPDHSTGASVDSGIRVLDYDFDGRADLFLMDAVAAPTNLAYRGSSVRT